MEYSNEYKSRHGFADFEKLTFQITNKKEEPNVICELLKVPEYSFEHKYTEKICEGNGWYSKGETITKNITHDFYWLVILDTSLKKTLSLKYAIEDLKGKKYVNEFLKNI